MEEFSPSAYWDSVAEKRKRGSNTDGISSIKINMDKTREIIRRLLQYDFSKKYVLEIGCGQGTLPAILGTLYAPQMRYVGIDISNVSAKIASSIFNVKVIQAESSNLPFKSRSFDYVFAFDSMEHIPFVDKHQTYQEIDRVLKPHGQMIINNPLDGSLHDTRVEHGFSNSDFSNLCSICLFTVDSIETYTVHPQNTKFQLIRLTR